jgi:hypothetical protein
LKNLTPTTFRFSPVRYRAPCGGEINRLFDILLTYYSEPEPVIGVIGYWGTI